MEFPGSGSALQLRQNHHSTRLEYKIRRLSDVEGQRHPLLESI